MSEQLYDIIGDIHGHADALCRLLLKLGYAESQGAFRHGSRNVIFVGDFIDRGPQQVEVLRVVRAMYDAGAAIAVLGNHEFNSIAWATRDHEGAPLRKHSKANAKQHAEFLNQLDDQSQRDAVSWFRQLPVWLELPGLRVVHACWHDPSRLILRSCLDSQNCFTEEGLHRASMRNTAEYAAAEILLKGPEQSLPAGISFLDKDGHRRTKVRTGWWDTNATTFRKSAIGMDDRLGEIPDTPLPIDFRYLDDVPVLFGHYWMKGEPALTASNAGCLDFSVARQGYLTAYRWSGERELSARHFVYVQADV
jgi:hypothetical protein